MLIENVVKVKLVSRLGLYNILRSKYIAMADIFYKRKYNKMIKNDYKLNLPQSFVMEPTAKCNLNCKMCYLRDHKAGKREMTFEDFKRIVEGIPSMKYLVFTGGEVFTRPDFLDMLGFLKNKGIKTLITTNGTLITSANIDKISKNSNITQFVISVDGTQETHNRIRGWEKAFQRSSEAITILRKKFFVNVVCVLQDENIKELPEVVKWAGSMGLDSVIFEYERKYTKKAIEEAKRVTHSGAKDIPLTVSRSEKPMFSIHELKDAMKLANEAARGTGVKVYFLPKYFEKEMSACYGRSRRKEGRYFCRLFFKPRIDPQGNIVHCYAVRKPMGNLLEKPFDELWNSDEMIKLRKDLIENNMLPICENCLYLQRI
jgi:radical SAM protein with 4Fe4S-binding SPASM domain